MPKTIMLVDDDSAIIYTLGRLLESHGYTVKKVYSGKKCLEEVGKLKGQVDLILMDISMPELDGITAFYIIKKKFPHIKIIFLSATQPSPQAAKMITDEGIKAHIDKPFDNERILELINKTLNS